MNGFSETAGTRQEARSELCLVPIATIVRCSAHHRVWYGATCGDHQESFMPSLGTLPIGVLVAKSGIDAVSIRKYERLGLISRPRRNLGGLALYSPETIDRLGFIRRALALGFPETALRKLLSPARNTCEDVYQHARQHLAGVRKRIEDLKQIEQTLAPLVEACPREGGETACPILRALSKRPTETPQE